MGGRTGLRIAVGTALAATVGLAAYASADPARDATIRATRLTADQGLAGAFADCPAGRRAVGGGVVSTGSRPVYVAASGPLDGSGAGGPLDPSGSVVNTRNGDLARRWYAGVSNPSSAKHSIAASRMRARAVRSDTGRPSGAAARRMTNMLYR